MRSLIKQIWSYVPRVSRRCVSMASPDDYGWEVDAEKIFTAGLKAVQPKQLVANAVIVDNDVLTVNRKEYPLNRNVYVVGFGKAALGFVNYISEKIGSHLIKGIVSCPLPPQNVEDEEIQQLTSIRSSLSSRIQVFYGPSTNIPNATVLRASEAVAALVDQLDSQEDVLLTVITGGGSALLTLPEPDIALCDMIKTTELMSRAGCNINEMNIVRKQIDQLKGGGLAKRAYPARIVSLILSDVINDPLDIIASGPTVKDNHSCHDAMEVLTRRNLLTKLSRTVMAVLSDQKKHVDAFTFEHVNNFIFGNNSIALRSAQRQAVDNGYSAVVLTNSLAGDAGAVANILVSIIEICLSIFCTDANEKPNEERLSELLDKLCGSGHVPVHELVSSLTRSRKVCLLAGGETTVTVPDKAGYGGRAAHTALAAAERLHEFKERSEKIVLLVGSTDGLDGPTDRAGAWVSTKTMSQSQHCGVSSRSALETCDAYNFFQNVMNGRNIRRGGLSGTNVMDVVVITMER